MGGALHDGSCMRKIMGLVMVAIMSPSVARGMMGVVCECIMSFTSVVGHDGSCSIGSCSNGKTWGIEGGIWGSQGPLGSQRSHLRDPQKALGGVIWGSCSPGSKGFFHRRIENLKDREAFLIWVFSTNLNSSILSLSWIWSWPNC